MVELIYYNNGCLVRNLTTYNQKHLFILRLFSFYSGCLLIYCNINIYVHLFGMFEVLSTRMQRAENFIFRDMEFMSYPLVELPTRCL